jgi:hypothetical protein
VLAGERRVPELLAKSLVGSQSVASLDGTPMEKRTERVNIFLLYQ